MWLARFPGRDVREAAYQEDYYREETGGRFSGPFERASVWFRERRVRQVLARAPGPGAILDVGCGRGIMLAGFKARGWRVLGTQLSRTAADAARRLRGVEVECAELTELALPPASFDVVTIFHVLEHLADPLAYLRKARELLAPGGLLVLEVPDHSGPGFRALGIRHLCFDHPNHLFFFTSRSLAELLPAAGFRVEETTRFSLEYSPFTTLQNLLNALPGETNRLYRALMGNVEGKRLRAEPATWLHFLLAGLLALPALLISAASPAFRSGNTIRLYCRPV
jgi:SAM-dependent methyltransferase